MKNGFFYSLIFLVALLFSCSRDRRADDRTAALNRAVFEKRYQAQLGNATRARTLLDSFRRASLSRSDTANIAHAEYLLGKTHLQDRNLDSAFYHLNQSRQYYESLADSLQVAEKLILLGDIHWHYNDYFGVESASLEALRFLGTIDSAYDTIYAGIVYNAYGLASMGTRDYPSAQNLFMRADSLTGDPLGKKFIANNLAWSFMERGDFARAIEILNPQRLIAVDDPEANAKVLDNLGYSMFRTGRADGLDHMLESLRIRRENQNHFGLVPVSIHLSEYHKNNPALAMEYAMLAYRSALKAKSPDDRLEALQNLRNLTSGERRQGYSDQWIALKDSLDKMRQASRNQFARMRYDARQATQENLQLKAVRAENLLRIRQREYQNAALLTGIALLLAAGYASYRRIGLKHRNERAAEVQKTEERISKRLHDELANDVFNAMAFAESQNLADPNVKETLLGSLDSVYARTRDISRENAPVDTGLAFADNLRSLLFGFNTSTMNVLVQGLEAVQWERVSDVQKSTLWRVLQELMVNNKKHSGASLTAIRFQARANEIRVEYTDNGRGLDEGLRDRGHGLRNVENRMATIGGTVNFDSEPGKGLSAAISILL